MTARVTLIVAGGTTEGRQSTLALLAAGYRVVLSQATTVPFELAPHPELIVRVGPLDLRGFEALIREHRASAIVDAAHPYATALHETVRALGRSIGIPFYRLARQQNPIPLDCALVKSHAVAAELACRSSRRILITVGSRNLETYVIAARRHQTKLFARLLDHEQSELCVARLGLSRESIIYGKGPFSLQANIAALRSTRASIMITKDSGAAGGFNEKLAAVRTLKRTLIVVARPTEDACALESIGQVLKHVIDQTRTKPWQISS